MKVLRILGAFFLFQGEGETEMIIVKNTEALVESKSLRNDYIEKTEVIEKANELIFLPNTELMTVEQVAQFYTVGEKAINAIMLRHKDELLEDGHEVLKGKEFVNFKMQFANSKDIFNSKARTIAVFPRRAILRVGMLLRDSEVAKQVRTYLLDTEEQSTHRKFTDFCDEYKFDIKVVQTTLTYYYQARNLMKNMGYSGNTTKMLKDYFDPSEKKMIDRAWYISEDGLIRFCTGFKRKKMVHVLAQHLGIKSFMSPVEVDIVYALQVAFPDLTIGEKKTIEGSKEEIDIYIEDLKWAIEVDENGHAGYDQVNELRRQKMFEDALGCTFHRINPHKPGFTVGEIIADIRNELKEVHFLFCSNCKNEILYL